MTHESPIKTIIDRFGIRLREMVPGDDALSRAIRVEAVRALRDAVERRFAAHAR